MSTTDTTPALAPLDHEIEVELEDAWADRPGLLGFFTTVDHKRMGIRYMYTAFAFFFVAGFLALIMRAQLTEPNETLVSGDLYNQLFTMHGTTMIFLFNTPVLAGFGNYLLPLMIGSARHGFPASATRSATGSSCSRGSSCTRASSSAKRPMVAGSRTCR